MNDKGEYYNVVISMRDGVVIAISRQKLTSGIGIGERAYRVWADNRSKAIQRAKDCLRAGEPSHHGCWI